MDSSAKANEYSRDEFEGLVILKENNLDIGIKKSTIVMITFMTQVLSNVIRLWDLSLIVQYLDALNEELMVLG